MVFLQSIPCRVMLSVRHLHFPLLVSWSELRRLSMNQQTVWEQLTRLPASLFYFPGISGTKYCRCQPERSGNPDGPANLYGWCSVFFHRRQRKRNRLGSISKKYKKYSFYAQILLTLYQIHTTIRVECKSVPDSSPGACPLPGRRQREFPVQKTAPVLWWSLKMK